MHNNVGGAWPRGSLPLVGSSREIYHSHKLIHFQDKIKTKVGASTSSREELLGTINEYQTDYTLVRQKILTLQNVGEAWPRGSLSLVGSSREIYLSY